MKKLLSLLLALAMMFGVMVVLASCGECTAHVDDDGDQKCDNCGATMNKGLYGDWDETEVIMKINLVEGVFVNLGKRYISGEAQGYTAPVDRLISQRNDAAKKATNVTLKYDYWEPSDSNGAWNKSQNTIAADVKSASSSSSAAAKVPDIYVTANYDIHVASLQGNLANLLRTETKEFNADGTVKSTTPVENYFSFLDEDYFKDGDDLGYNYELMLSHSPVPDKAMFVLSSDYTIDTYRALHAIPVSVTRLENINVTTAVNEKGVPAAINKNGDDVFSIGEFVTWVLEEKAWTWDVMASLCAAVYVPSSQFDGEHFTSPSFGFYIDVWGGASGSAIAQSSSIPLINKTGTDENGNPVYETASVDILVKLAEAFGRLLDTTGAMRVTNTDCRPYTQTTDASIAAVACAEKFGRNEVLFGDNAVIGVIEGSEFQKLKNNGSFGIVPMPLVESAAQQGKSASEVDYTTTLGTAARSAVISVKTDNFSEATAILDYQSKNSGTILQSYFKSQQKEASDGKQYNIDMLNYLRTILVDQFSTAMTTLAQYTAGSLTLEQEQTYLPGYPDTSKYLDLEYDNSNQQGYSGVSSVFRGGDDTIQLLRDLYSEQFLTTQNAMFKAVVDKYVDLAGKN